MLKYFNDLMSKRCVTCAVPSPLARFVNKNCHMINSVPVYILYSQLIDISVQILPNPLSFLNDIVIYFYHS